MRIITRRDYCKPTNQHAVAHRLFAYLITKKKLSLFNAFFHRCESCCRDSAGQDNLVAIRHTFRLVCRCAALNKSQPFSDFFCSIKEKTVNRMGIMLFNLLLLYLFHCNIKILRYHKK